MRYTALAIALVVGVVFLVVLITYLVQVHLLKPRKERAWAKAREDALWADNIVTENGRATVTVQKVAKLGHRRQVVDQQLIGVVLPEAADHDQELHDLWTKASQRAYLLNHGPLL